MSRLLAAARRYPLVAATIVLGLVGIGLALGGLADSLVWLFGGFGLFVAAISAVGMVKQLRHGSFGVDLLAITAIVSTVVVG